MKYSPERREQILNSMKRGKKRGKKRRKCKASVRVEAPAPKEPKAVIRKKDVRQSCARCGKTMQAIQGRGAACEACALAALRESCGLSVNRVRTRKCLGCGCEFTSEGGLNRMCTQCSRYNNHIVRGAIDDLMELGWRHGAFQQKKTRKKQPACE